MMKSFLFQRPTVEAKAKEELEQARMDLLTAETNAEYWDAQAAYNRSRIERLEEFLQRDKKVVAA